MTSSLIFIDKAETRILYGIIVALLATHEDDQ